MDNYLDFRRFIELKYILSPTPGYNFKFFLPLIITFGLLIIVGAVGSYILKKREKFLKPIANRLLKFGLSIGLTGLLLIFLRYENLPFLSMRIWLMLLAIVAIVWSILLIVFIISYLPRAKSNLAKQKVFQKYLPRKKGK